MDAKREADELVSRCVALVVFYQHCRKTHPGWPGIKAEFRSIVSEARKGGISPAVIASGLLIELRARYEPATASRMHREFLAGFSDDVQIDFVTA
jgi:hypothetical protein